LKPSIGTTYFLFSERIKCSSPACSLRKGYTLAFHYCYSIADLFFLNSNFCGRNRLHSSLTNCLVCLLAQQETHAIYANHFKTHAVNFILSNLVFNGTISCNRHTTQLTVKTKISHTEGIVVVVFLVDDHHKRSLLREVSIIFILSP
jgi:hypothetical protein